MGGGPRLSRRAFVAAAGAAAAAAALPVAAAESSGALQIWFVRHAESEINVPGNPRPVADGGMTYPLTRKGVEQAKSLAQATADAPIVAVYTSTYLRAVQTADAVAFRHDLTLSLAPEAVEVDLGIKPGSPEDPRAV
jgi:probable phosphoglycerate mutase